MAGEKTYTETQVLGMLQEMIDARVTLRDADPRELLRLNMIVREEVPSSTHQMTDSQKAVLCELAHLPKVLTSWRPYHVRYYRGKEGTILQVQAMSLDTIATHLLVLSRLGLVEVDKDQRDGHRYRITTAGRAAVAEIEEMRD